MNGHTSAPVQAKAVSHSEEELCGRLLLLLWRRWRFSSATADKGVLLLVSSSAMCCASSGMEAMVLVAEGGIVPGGVTASTSLLPLCND